MAWIFWIFHDLLEDLVILAAIFYPVVFLGIVIGLIVLLVIGIKKLFEEVCSVGSGKTLHGSCIQRFWRLKNGVEVHL